MSIGGKIDISDTWKSLSSAKINVGGTWKNITNGYVLVNGIWKSIPFGGNYELGLTASLISVPAQNSAAWTYRSADISAYIGATARLVVKYISGSSYTGDAQIDDINIGGNSYDPEGGTHSFQRNSVAGITTDDYSSVSWEALADTAIDGKWVRDGFGTVSGSTGLTSGNTGSYYYYCETSGSGTNYKRFWLRSPIVTINNGTLSLYTAQYGATCGSFNVYLDIIS